MSFPEPQPRRCTSASILSMQGGAVALASVALLWFSAGFGQPHALAQGVGPAPAATQLSEQVSELTAKGFELLASNDVAGAETAFRKAIEAQPENVAAHRGLALALWNQGQGTAALHELTVATRLDPSDVDAHYALGRLALALSLQPDLAQTSASKLSRVEFQNLAVRCFSKALSLRPQAMETRLSLVEAYLYAGRMLEARAEAEAAARQAPADPTAHLALGRAYFAGGEEVKAEAEFKAASALDPTRGDAFYELGQLHLFQKRLAEAKADFSRAIALSPDSAPAYSALAGLMIRAGEPAEARKLLEKAAALEPGDWRSQYELAGLLIEAGDVTRATGLLEKVARLQPDFLPAQEQLAMGLVRRGDLDGATAQADRLIAGHPQAAEGHRVMALVLWKQRNYEMSLAECAQVLATEPDSPQMLALQAIGLWQLKRRKEAQQAFRDAAKVQSNVGTAEVFCRLLLCDARDIAIIEEFLRKNRWTLLPPTP